MYKVPGMQNPSPRYLGFHKGLDTTPARILGGVVQPAQGALTQSFLLTPPHSHADYVAPSGAEE